MFKGDTETLIATIYPENATNESLQWSSSNTDVTTIDINGIITANGYGTTTITASSIDGSNQAAPYLVTVIRPAESHLPQLFENPQRRVRRLLQPLVHDLLVRVHLCGLGLTQRVLRLLRRLRVPFRRPWVYVVLLSQLHMLIPFCLSLRTSIHCAPFIS